MEMEEWRAYTSPVPEPDQLMIEPDSPELQEYDELLFLGDVPPEAVEAFAEWRAARRRRPEPAQPPLRRSRRKRTPNPKYFGAWWIND